MSLSNTTSYTQIGLRYQNHPYNCIICGSDSIWGVQNHSGVLNFDSAYFLDFVTNPSVRKVSYAASFGPTTTFDQRKKQVCNMLHKFDAISLRESSGVEILKRECNIQATHVLDPTFLIDFQDVKVDPHVKNDYVLIYGWFTPTERSYIQAFAKQEGLDIIAVGNPDTLDIADINIFSIGPEEWLGYFAFAKYIFTTFFHGVVFSIIFQQSFSVFERPDKLAKIESLLNDLNLTNRIVTSEMLSNCNPTFCPINYTQANSVIDHMLKVSTDYLSCVTSI